MYISGLPDPVKIQRDSHSTRWPRPEPSKVVRASQTVLVGIDEAAPNTLDVVDAGEQLWPWIWSSVIAVVVHCKHCTECLLTGMPQSTLSQVLEEQQHAFVGLNRGIAQLSHQVSWECFPEALPFLILALVLHANGSLIVEQPIQLSKLP